MKNSRTSVPLLTRARPKAASHRRQHYLHAGQLFASAEPTEVVTILGSCVAVCLFEPHSHLGGINHYLLPHAVQRDASPRFGAVAIPRLIEEMLRAGARRNRLQAKVFGGACVIGAFRKPTGHLGQENLELAFRVLASEEIAVVEQDVGGTQGRKLIFHTDDGSAWVRRL